MQGELAKAHEQDEHLFCVVVLQVLPSRSNLPLDAAVEVALGLRLKVQALLGDDRGCRKLGESFAHLCHGPVQAGLLHDLEAVVGVVQLCGRIPYESKQVVHVFDTVHNGRGGYGPEGLALQGLDGLVCGTAAVSHTVGLVQDNPVPGVCLKQAHLVGHLLVVAYIQPGTHGVQGRHPLPHGRGLVESHHVDRTASGGGDPLGNDGLGAQEEGETQGRVLHEAEDFHRLAESHLIAEEAAALGRSLPLQHPLDADVLVGLVGETGPKRYKGTACKHG